MSERRARAARRAERAERTRRRGPILPGDREATTWTFTAGRWTVLSYLWLDGDRVLLSSVHATAKRRGYLRDLVAGIEAAGFQVAIPTPILDMPQILAHCGFVKHYEAMPSTGQWRETPGGRVRRWLLTSHGPIAEGAVIEDDDITDVWQRPGR